MTAPKARHKVRGLIGYGRGQSPKVPRVIAEIALKKASQASMERE